jgi:hypothetical protein
MSVSTELDRNSTQTLSKPEPWAMPRWNVRLSLSFALIASGSIWLALGLALRLALR